MKRCSMCKKDKSSNEFNRNSRKKDGLSTMCAPCSREYGRKYYRSDKKSAVDRSKKNRQKFRAVISEYKSSKGCKCCKETESCCLDFHHTNSDLKEGEISRFVSENQQTKAWAEIEKCIVVCANCHRKIHAGLICY